jgi:4a-hydroxytetrahydrobiopterin dehydratase
MVNSSIQCAACQVNAPAVSDYELSDLVRSLPNWSVPVHNDVMKLERKFTFKTFNEALSFANDIGKISDNEGHHPQLVVSWGSVVVRWWSMKIKTLHKQDFLMASKSDSIYELGYKC